MRRLIPVIVLLVLMAFVVWAFLPRPVDVEVAAVTTRDLDVAVEEEGVARIREVYTVSATIAGKLQRISLHAGDSVTEGQTVVASIGPAEPALLDARARAVAGATEAATQAAVDFALAQLSQAEAMLEYSTSMANRSIALYEKSAISTQLYDSAIRDQRTAQAAVDSARANLSVRQQELKSAQAVLQARNSPDPESCCVKIVAPASGMVLRTLTESEQVVQPGTPILEIGNPENLEIAVDLLSRDAVQVKTGTAATIIGWGGAPISARVERVEPSAETKVSALGIEEQRVKVILKLTAPYETWKELGHGFRVIARIVLWHGSDVLTIPVGALFRDGRDWATYLVRDGKAELQLIKIGARNEDYAQVLDGLSANDQVILHPSDVIADGVAVEPALQDDGKTTTQ